MNVIVTGANKGIGFELAKLFISEGHCVIGLSKSDDGLKQLQTAAGKGTFIPLCCDLSEDTFSVVLIDVLKKNNIQCVDILVNNAGYLVKKPFEKITSDELKKSYAVNLFAPFMLVSTLLPYLTCSSVAHIVNISSMGGMQGSVKFPGLTAYSSSKGALAVFTECLALELSEANNNIKVNCLALGAVNTEMLREAFPGYEAKVSAAAMAKYIKDFALTGYNYFNGKIIPVSVSTP